MSPVKKRDVPKQGPPIQFRPGVELEQLIQRFASKHQLPLNEACKALVALAVTEMDGRFYPLICQAADAIGGTNAFARACKHIETSLITGVRVAGKRILREPQRSSFILTTVRELLSLKSKTLHVSALSSLPGMTDSSSVKPVPKRKVSRNIDKNMNRPRRETTDKVIHEEELVDGGWSSTGSSRQVEQITERT